MSKLIAIILYLILTLQSCNAFGLHSRVNVDDNDFKVITERIQAYFINNTLLPDSLISSYISLISDEGSFKDIDYDSHEQTEWPPIYHLERLIQMAGAYINGRSNYYSKKSIYNNILLGLNYYLNKNPWSTNWYKGQIWEPKDLGLILVLMEKGKDKLPEDLIIEIIEKWKNCGADPSQKDGTDRTEVAQHWVYFSLIQRDTDHLLSSLYYIFEPLKYNINNGGIQIDNSYMEHGNQLYIGGYGTVFLDIIIRFGLFCQGTPFELSEEKVDILRKYMLETVSDAIRGQYMFFNCLGRSIAREGFLHYLPLSDYFENLVLIDPKFSTDYEIVASRIRGDTPPNYMLPRRHTHYYNSDYTTHIRENYSFAVRLVSNRTIRNETMSNENIKGYYISDGSTCITSQGGEYFDIFPLWDWNRVPGTTCPQVDPIPRTFGYNVPGTSMFSGGVSDSIYGVSCYKYYDTYQDINTGANKSFFFFDDEIVCLGSNIRSSYPVLTCLDQNWGGDYFDCFSLSDQLTRIFESNNDFTFDNSLKYVHHNQMGYFFPSGCRVVIRNKQIEGRWTDINISGNQDDKNIKGKVFSISIDHQIPSAENGTDKYSYIIVPGVSQDEMKDYAKINPVEIVENSDSIQAVYHKELDIMEIVFYSPAVLDYSGKRITTNKPCCILLKNFSDPQLIDCHLCDPSQSKMDISIEVYYKKNDLCLYSLATFSKVPSEKAGKTMHLSFRKIPTSISDYNMISELKIERIGDKSYLLKPMSEDFSDINVFNIKGQLLTKLRGVNYYIKFPSKGVYVIIYKNKKNKVFVY